MKKIFIYLLFIWAVLLFWCGSSENLQTVSFSKYELKLPINYKTYPPTVVENKQISFKVLKVFKESPNEYNKQNKESNNFKTNIIISEDNIKNISSKEYVNYQVDKLKRNIVWLSVIEKGIFNVNNTTINYVKYYIDDNIVSSLENISYYWAQFYIVEKSKTYIISIIANQKSVIDNLFDKIESTFKVKEK